MFGYDPLETAVLIGSAIVFVELVICTALYLAFHMHETESEFTFDMPFNVVSSDDS